MPGSKPTAGRFHQRLREQATEAAQTVGAGECRFVQLFFQPAVLEQQVKNQHRLFARAAQGRDIFIAVIAQHWAAGDRLSQHVHDLITVEAAPAIVLRPIHAGIQRPQSSGDLASVFARQGPKELCVFRRKQHGKSSTLH